MERIQSTKFQIPKTKKHQKQKFTGINTSDFFGIWNLEFGTSSHQRGSTLIDAIVGAALMLVVFAGLFGIIQLALQSVGLGKARTGAVALANEQMEYLRSLPYASVGVLGGIPAGMVPAEEAIMLNNISYVRRTFIQFIDDPADGVGASDVNGIQADYKAAKVSVSWTMRGMEREASLVTNIVPKGIETLDGGGTLAINVIDASGMPVENAEISIVNGGTNPSISIATFSNNTGTAYFPGAPQSSTYEIVVSKSGYSTDRTYLSSLENPNPMPGTLTVVDATVTSATFKIDRLANITVRSFDEIQTATWTDPFIDMSLVESSLNTTLGAGEMVLTGAPGSYALSGTVTSVALAPALLNAWTEIIFDTTTNASTTASIQVHYSNGASSGIVPDSALPGNSAGFTSSPIDISNLSVVDYPSLSLVAALATSDVLVTPALDEWSIVYREGPVPRPNVAFDIRGTKTIGTDGGGLPIYKYENDFSTNGSGVFGLEDMEWDSYVVTPDASESGLSIVDMCPFALGLDPGVNQILDIIFAPASTHSLRVYVTDDQGQPLENATVNLTRTGYDETIGTSACGQAYFRGLGAFSYTLDISAAGYVTQNIPDVAVSGEGTYSVLLNP